ncbi:MAG: FtsQ-type POTRA domain-containing protein, partial [Candidatus Margulisbacteria bacterium]|nr:FtsQ-type POTRA domain-containing protein [Candidatus Margulisiibacteriota bacterium]
MFKRFLRWLIVFSLLFFILLQGWQFFVNIPLWKLSEVEVNGNLYWDQNLILSQIEMPLGESIFAIDLKKLKEKVESLPQIKAVKPKRKLPATIILNIEERIPWAKTSINGENIILDYDGKILN